MTREEEDALFARLAAGDGEAFARLYHELRTPVYTVLYRVVGQRETAEDLTHDLFLRLYEAPPGTEVHSKRAWVFRMARNLAIDALRTSHPTEEADETLPAEEGERELSLDLSAALQSLPPEEREIVTWHAVLGLPFREITQITGMNLPLVWRRYRNAISKLKKQMGEV